MCSVKFHAAAGGAPDPAAQDAEVAAFLQYSSSITGQNFLLTMALLEPMELLELLEPMLPGQIPAPPVPYVELAARARRRGLPTLELGAPAVPSPEPPAPPLPWQLLPPRPCTGCPYLILLPHPWQFLPPRPCTGCPCLLLLPHPWQLLPPRPCTGCPYLPLLPHPWQFLPPRPWPALLSPKLGEKRLQREQPHSRGVLRLVCMPKIKGPVPASRGSYLWNASHCYLACSV